MRSTCTDPRICWLLGVVVCLLAPPVAAQDWQRLVMPGEVIEGHASLEADCSNCHRPFRPREQRDLCLACHDHSDVASDMKHGEGFHGRSRARDSLCSSCHSEHLGREADILGLDVETFDHALTDYPLHGLHQTVGCADCHDAAKRYREAASDCNDCHREDDVHRGSLGEDCASCHEEGGWGKARFDHDRTDFPLTGKHVDASCASCHPGARFADTPLDCQSCHKLNDVHGGRLGPRCDSCHSSRGWTQVAFDHGRDTEFPLRGSHGPLRCEACHKSNAYEVKLRTDCYACHQVHDEHKGRFGERCEDCHTESSWKDERFDHARTDFPLRGAHEGVSCITCHTGVLKEGTLPSTCIGCHRGDDVHDGQQGEACGGCHDESGWRQRVFFDHGLARFPLLGLHAAAPCEECHRSNRFHEAPLRCVECHASDDFHEQRLGPTCDVCHNPNGWTFWRFDHDSQTDFVLDGGHAKLACRDCHTRPVKGVIRLPMGCAACHATDDVHLGSYGHDCARCHSTSDWKRVERLR